MDVLTDRSNVNTKNNFSLDLSVRQISCAKDMPDLYPEPDSIHTHPQLKELGIASNDEGEGKSVLSLQPFLLTENDDSVSVDNAPYAEEDGKLTANAPQVLNSTCEPSPSSLSLGTIGSVIAESSGDNDGASAESADVVGDTMIKPLQSHTKKGQRRPGVILLGRGNSFSLGRSEVIFLHNTKPYRRGKEQTSQHQGIPNGRDKNFDQVLHSSTAASTTSMHTLPTVSTSNCSPSAGTSGSEPSRPSPPPLSNQVCVSADAANHTSRPITFTSGKSTQADCPERLSGALAMSSETSTVFERHSEGDGDELAALWARAELTMASKQRAVLDVLAQFGVGESGKDTEDGGEAEEEESVWQVVESKAHAVVR